MKITLSNDVEIYFHDLNHEAQQFLLDFHRVASPKVKDWDTVPLAVMTEPASFDIIDKE